MSYRYSGHDNTSSSLSTTRGFLLHYNGGTKTVTADCTRTRTLRDLLLETLLSASGNNADAVSLAKEVDEQYHCVASNDVTVSLSIPTQLAPSELYITSHSGHPIDILAGTQSTESMSTTSHRGRGRAGRRGRGGGRGRSAPQRKIYQLEKGNDYGSSGEDSMSTLRDKESDGESTDTTDSGNSLPRKGRSAGRGRGGRGGRGRGRGGTGSAVLSSPNSKYADGFAGAPSLAASRASSATSRGASSSIPEDVYGSATIGSSPLKRKRGRPPKHPPKSFCLSPIVCSEKHVHISPSPSECNENPTTLPTSSSVNAQGYAGGQRVREVHPDEDTPLDTLGVASARHSTVPGTVGFEMKPPPCDLVTVPRGQSDGTSQVAAVSFSSPNDTAVFSPPDCLQTCRINVIYNRFTFEDPISGVLGSTARVARGGSQTPVSVPSHTASLTQGNQASNGERALALTLADLPSSSTGSVWPSGNHTPVFLLSHPHAYLALPQIKLYGDPMATEPVGFCGQSIIVPIVVGSCTQLVQPDSKDKSHRWTVYVRGLFNGRPAQYAACMTNGMNSVDTSHDNMECDYLSDFISHVTFVLDRSFNPCVRTVYKAPFELTEVGWGEFVVSIHVHLKYNGKCAATRRIRHKLRQYFCSSSGRAVLPSALSLVRGVAVNEVGAGATVPPTTSRRGTRGSVLAGMEHGVTNSMLDINGSSGARSLFYRGPFLPPYLVDCSSGSDSSGEEDTDNNSSDDDNAVGKLGAPGDGVRVKEEETDSTVPGTRSPVSEDDALLPFTPVSSMGSEDLSPRKAQFPTDERDWVNSSVPAAASVALNTSVGTTEHGRPGRRRGRAAGLAGRRPTSHVWPNTTSVPTANEKGNIVVLSHLLRFSHRPKQPPMIPPAGDIRSRSRLTESLGYALVPDPCVTECYDEILLPVRSAAVVQTKNETDYTSLAAVAMPNGDVLEKGCRSASPACLSRTNAHLIRSACLLESRLRRVLRATLERDGGKTSGSCSSTPIVVDDSSQTQTSPSSASMPSEGVSCWPHITNYGNALEKDEAFTISFLRSIASTARKEGWLDAALLRGADAVKPEREVTACESSEMKRYGCKEGLDVGGLECTVKSEHNPLHETSPITRIEYNLACDLMRMGELEGRSYFMHEILPRAGAISAAAWSAQEKHNRKTGNPGQYKDSYSRHHGFPDAAAQKRVNENVDSRKYTCYVEGCGKLLGTRCYRHGSDAYFVSGEKKAAFGHVPDLEQLQSMKEALMKEIYALRCEASRRQAAVTQRQI